jgi:spore coat polysaccharide biosynthesis protein SpsF
LKIAAVILSRYDSSRLPGKALLKIAGRPIIQYVIELCKSINNISDVVLATTNRKIDDNLVKFAESQNIKVVRGSHKDVAGRFLQSMDDLDLDGAIRVTGDSPLNNVKLLNFGMKIFQNNKFDLVTNKKDRSYPMGMSMEIISKKAMRIAYGNIRSDDHREHVTKYFYENYNLFKIYSVTLKKFNYGNINLALDTADDFNKIKWIIKNLNSKLYEVDFEDLIKLSNKYYKL